MRPPALRLLLTALLASRKCSGFVANTCIGQGTTFNLLVSCQSFGSVVLITDTQYGVNNDSCKDQCCTEQPKCMQVANVNAAVSERCNGLPSCNVFAATIPAIELADCSNATASFLAVTFNCTPGTTVSPTSKPSARPFLTDVWSTLPAQVQSSSSNLITTSPDLQAGHGGIGSDAIIGIGVGAGCVVIICAVLLTFFLMRQRNARRSRRSLADEDHGFVDDSSQWADAQTRIRKRNDSLLKHTAADKRPAKKSSQAPGKKASQGSSSTDGTTAVAVAAAARPAASAAAAAAASAAAAAAPPLASTAAAAPPLGSPAASAPGAAALPSAGAAAAAAQPRTAASEAPPPAPLPAASYGNQKASSRRQLMVPATSSVVDQQMNTTAGEARQKSSTGGSGQSRQPASQEGMRKIADAPGISNGEMTKEQGYDVSRAKGELQAPRRVRREHNPMEANMKPEKAGKSSNAETLGNSGKRQPHNAEGRPIKSESSEAHSVKELKDETKVISMQTEVTRRPASIPPRGNIQGHETLID